MGLILDSSVVIAAERMGQTAYRMLEDIGIQSNDPEIAVSVVTVLELAHGITRVDTPQRRVRRQQFLDNLLVGMPIHAVTVPITLRAGQIDGQMAPTPPSPPPISLAGTAANNPARRPWNPCPTC